MNNNTILDQLIDEFRKYKPYAMGYDEGIINSEMALQGVTTIPYLYKKLMTTIGKDLVRWNGEDIFYYTTKEPGFDSKAEFIKLCLWYKGLISADEYGETITNSKFLEDPVILPKDIFVIHADMDSWEFIRTTDKNLDVPIYLYYQGDIGYHLAADRLLDIVFDEFKHAGMGIPQDIQYIKNPLSNDRTKLRYDQLLDDFVPLENE